MSPSQKELARPPILRVGSLTPKRLPIEIERPGSQTDPDSGEQIMEKVVLQAWDWRETRCPATVQDEVSQARERWFELRFAPDAPKDEAGDPVETPQQDAAYHDYLRDVLLALIPGLEWNEANAWVGDGDLTRATLEYLGFWKPSDKVVAGRRDTSDPPDGGESGTKTLPGSTPISSGTTTEPATKVGSRRRKARS